MSFTRADYIATYNFATKLYCIHSGRGEIAREAKDLAMRCEEAVGQLGRIPAECWRINNAKEG